MNRIIARLARIVKVTRPQPPAPFGARSQWSQWRISPVLLPLVDWITRLKLPVGLRMAGDMQSHGLKIPESVRGITELNRDLFTTRVEVPGLKVEMKNITPVIKVLKPYMFKAMKLNPVVLLPESDTSHSSHKVILLRPAVQVSDLSEAVKSNLEKYGVGLSLVKHKMVISYENWKADEILRAVLPSDLDNVSGFSNIGHIIHLNLRAEHEPYKSLIGQVLLDKNPIAKTVVNKTLTIHNVYRNFQMELLAGENQMEVTVKENGIMFKLDFSKVYWNPRLSTEHHKIVKIVRHGDVVFDVFAGIGPFAVPAAKKGALVYANDLNPDSYKWLKHNLSLNKVKTQYEAFNLDGRQFIKDVVKPHVLKEWQKGDDQSKMLVIMNLPGLAIEFLDAFVDLFKGCAELDQSENEYPSVFCYCFSNADDKQKDVCNRIGEVLGIDLNNDQVKFVRNVAPNKDMMCAHFQLTRRVLFGEEESSGQPPLKKICV